MRSASILRFASLAHNPAVRRTATVQSAMRRLSTLAAQAANGKSVKLESNYLRISSPEGHMDMHYRFLRHQCAHCLSQTCKHPQTGEHLVDPSELSKQAVRPKSARFVSEAGQESELVIDWEDGHRSGYPSSWLVQHAYSRNRVDARPANLPNNLADVTVAWNDRSPSKFRAILDRYNFIVVTGGPKTEEGSFAIVDEQFGGRDGIIPTHFGLVEDLMIAAENKTNTNTDQLGYTNAPVHPHTDQPFIDNPPSMQMLHCIRPAAKGGESTAVDAAAAAEYLRVHAPNTFWLLASVPIKFHRKQKNFTSIVVKPLFEMDDSHHLKKIRYSYFTMDPMNVPFEVMEAWYDAYIAFTTLIRTPENQYRKLLQSGDYLLYNNHLMLHARTGFEGSRHLRGIYLDAGRIHNHLLGKEQSGNVF